MQLLEHMGMKNIEVRLDSGEGRGKGLFAKELIHDGDEIFCEHALVRCRAGIMCAYGLDAVWTSGIRPALSPVQS